MKKIFLFLAVAGTAFLSSCSNDDDRRDNDSFLDNDTIAESFNVNNVNFTAQNGYSIVVPLDPVIFDSDVVLVYRRAFINNVSVWQPIPRTEYIGAQGEVDYDFNFTTRDVEIFMQTNDFVDITTVPQLTQNQTFRIVLVPAFIAQNVDTNNIDAVMSALQEYKNGGVPSIE